MRRVRRAANRILVTAALPYANGKIHLGHLAGAYLPADIYVRYQRSMKRDVLFISGSDEHGVPITISAEQEKTTPQAVVDRYHALNKAAFEQFGISFDMYSRTSLPLHHETAREFFLQFHSAGILKEKRERQLYDEKAKMFLPDRYVEGTCPVCQNPEARGDQCERCGTFLNPTELVNPRSKITGETPAVRETTHFYFPLGDYQQQLEEYIKAADARDGWKENVLQYCRSWFKEGLQDRAVTRDLQWGVKVPLRGFEEKVLYVWFDAVLGYISGTKEWAERKGQPELWKEYWCDPSTKYVAFIGKDNIVFHCIVFPAMLMAWNDNSSEQYILPENVPANEFLNFQGQKFSKSRGWGIDVDEFLEEFPPDLLRYTLATNLPESRDADFTWRDFQARTNNELADILGNFINRSLTFAHRTFQGTVPPRGELSALDKELLNQIKAGTIHAGELIDHYRFRDAMLEIMNVARFANKYFNDSEPWKTAKSDPQRCATTIHICLQTIRSLAILFEPILPFSTRKIWTMLNLSGNPLDAGWKTAGELALVEGHALGQPKILFTKIEDEVIQKHLQKLPPTTAQDTSQQRTAIKPTITIDAFKQVDFRIARVLTAERVPKSEKLLKLRVSIGNEERQILAGIAQHYKPENLVGKKIVVVANLAPAKLMGQESQGMLLAASNNDGELSVLTVDADISEGSIVK
ncbi:MAG: methionine--tRNA ligase [Ignavibacteriae bacterium]|nr:methionine--tRNA ligase [Ignavibacteria bacterium]MBI3363544.1 methionine--tRNA ligase [Ignavibacteriota bacterium]